MTLQDQLMASWNLAKPITFNSGLSIGNQVLIDHGKERQDFQKWWEKNGLIMVERVNAGL